jgi:hypothetical protein
MLGKTFKGMTDELLGWQTARLRQLAIAQSSTESPAATWCTRAKL